MTPRNHLIDLILAPSDEHAVRSTFFTIAGVTGATIQCLAIRPVTDDGASLRALQKVVEGVLTSYGERWDDVERTFVCRYREMLLGDDFTPISKLSGAFLGPRSPLHLQFALSALRSGPLAFRSLPRLLDVRWHLQTHTGQSQSVSNLPLQKHPARFPPLL